MKTLWLLGLAALLAAIIHGKFAATSSQAAPAPAEPVASAAPTDLEPTISLYLFLHKARPDSSAAHAMRIAATCPE